MSKSLGDVCLHVWILLKVHFLTWNSCWILDNAVSVVFAYLSTG